MHFKRRKQGMRWRNT